MPLTVKQLKLPLEAYFGYRLKGTMLPLLFLGRGVITSISTHTAECAA